MAKILNNLSSIDFPQDLFFNNSAIFCSNNLFL